MMIGSHLRIMVALSLLALLGFGTSQAMPPVQAQNLTTASSPILQKAAFADAHVIHQWNMVAETTAIVEPSNLLNSTPLNGGSSRNLLGLLQGQGRVEQFVISPNQQTVVFSFRWHESHIELYSVPASGGSLTLLGPSYPGINKSNQLVFGLSPDSSRVVFLTNLLPLGPIELFSVPIGGGEVTTLNAPLPGNHSIPGEVTAFAFIPNSTDLIYRALDVTGTISGKLYRVPLAGGASILLAAGVEQRAILISPDGAWLSYTNSQGLSVVPSDGTGAPVQLQDGQTLFHGFTPDSSALVYAKHPVGGLLTLYQVTLQSQVHTQIAEDLAQVENPPFRVTPDSRAVIYKHNATGELRVSPLSGGNPRTLTTEQAWLGSITFSADGQHAFISLGVLPNRGLYRITLADSTTLRLDDPTTNAGGLWDMLLTPSSQRFVYTARSATGAPNRIFSVAPTGGPVLALGSTLSDEEYNLWAIAVGPADTVLFTTGFSNPIPAQRWRNLYLVPADGSQPPQVIRPNLNPPTSNRILFLPLVQR